MTRRAIVTNLVVILSGASSRAESKDLTVGACGACEILRYAQDDKPGPSEASL